jgi:hypothetical protein
VTNTRMRASWAAGSTRAGGSMRGVWDDEGVRPWAGLAETAAASRTKNAQAVLAPARYDGSP